MTIERPVWPAGRGEAQGLETATTPRTPYRYVKFASEIWRALRRTVRPLLYRGDRVSCLVCESRFGRWPKSVDLTDCPRCGSYTRQKLSALTADSLGAEAGLAGKTLLYFAPDPGLLDFFRRRRVRVTTTDIAAPSVDLRADITDLPIPDGSFDYILNCHVLEHIPNDAAAMAELHRVLAPGGTAMIQVPIYGYDHTDEDFSVTDPAERTARFGQHDHVRGYAMDIVDRLARAGFEVEVSRPVRAMSEAHRQRYGVWDDIVFLCRKSRDG